MYHCYIHVGLKKLHLEISPKDIFSSFCFQNTSCLPTDVTGYFGLSYLVNIEELLITSSQVSKVAKIFLSVYIIDKQKILSFLLDYRLQWSVLSFYCQSFSDSPASGSAMLITAQLSPASKYSTRDSFSFMHSIEINYLRFKSIDFLGLGAYYPNAYTNVF